MQNDLSFWIDELTPEGVKNYSSEMEKFNISQL